MYCPNCGNNMGDNSNFCNNCGTSAGTKNFAPFGMSKKEYFKSEHCSTTAKNFLTINKALFVAIALSMLFTAFLYIQSVMFINDLIDNDQENIDTIVKKLEELGGESLEIDLGEFENYAQLDDALQREVGYTLKDLMKSTMYLSIGVVVVTVLLVILFAALAVFKISKGFAITTLVLSLLLSDNWVVIGSSIALLVFTIKLLKEYAQYSANANFFTNPNGSNEPYFGA